jgi:hypothetical protein
MGLLDWINPLNGITKALTDAYVAKEQAKNDKDRIAADVAIENLKARRDVVISAAVNDKWWSPRTLMGYAAALYVFKIIVWDTVFQLGVTPDPGEQVTFIVMTVVGFYFISSAATGIADRIAATRRKP